MHRSAAVLCQDAASLRTLNTVLAQMEIEPVACHSQQEAMDQILTRQCAALVVDFDLPGAAEIAKLSSLLETSQRPLLLAMTAVWPGSGQAFQSGASRILYKPLQAEQVKDAFEIANKAARREGRNAPRYKITSVVWLELATGTLPAVALNLSEHGMAIRTTEAIRAQSNVSFRCALPGGDQIHGHADIIWSDAAGCAGMFFSRLSLSAQKHLKDWLHQRTRLTQGKSDRGKIVRSGKMGLKTNRNHSSVRDLLPPRDSVVRIILAK
jgi:ActR/RegA family two-component response regulator